MQVFQKSQRRKKVLDDFLNMVADKTSTGLCVVNTPFFEVRECEVYLKHPGVLRSIKPFKYTKVIISGDYELFDRDGIHIDTKFLKELILLNK